MKIKIGKYPDRLMCKLYSNYMNKKYGHVSWPTEYTRFERCLDWLDDRIQDFYNIFNWLWFDRRQQKIKVHIDPWDTWSMDHTLADIVLPMLIQLKETKHGSPMVDDADVPHLPKQGNTSNEGYQYDLFDSDEQDELFWDQYDQRWNWVLNEMIYAFDCKANKDEVYMRFDIKDRDAIDKEQDRISNGFRLFGKYYEGLWN